MYRSILPLLWKLFTRLRYFPASLTTALETTVPTIEAEPDREYDNPSNPDVDIPAAREFDNTTASEDVYVPVIPSDNDSNTDSDQ